MGRIAVPDLTVRQADVAKRQAEEALLADDYACIAYQGAYTQELIDETDYPSFDIEAANKAFYEWKKCKKKRYNGVSKPWPRKPNDRCKSTCSSHRLGGCAG
jgi:hypothetical protein